LLFGTSIYSIIFMILSRFIFIVSLIFKLQLLTAPPQFSSAFFHIYFRALFFKLAKNAQILREIDRMFPYQDQPQYFYVAELCSHLNPSSAFPGQGFETFEKYYGTKYGIHIQNTSQPLLDVDHTSARYGKLLYLQQ